MVCKHDIFFFFFPACQVVNKLSESHRLQLNWYFHWFYRILCAQTDQAYLIDADGLYMHNTFFIVCDVSCHEVAVGISSVTAALVYLLIWSDLVLPERSRFCDRCCWMFYFFFICITGDMVLFWSWHGMFRPNLVFWSQCLSPRDAFSSCIYSQHITRTSLKRRHYSIYSESFDNFNVYRTIVLSFYT